MSAATMRGTVERHISVDVTVDVRKFCAHYKAERASFAGDDEAFVRESLDIMGDDLLDENQPDGDDGLTVDWCPLSNDIDIWIQAVEK